jgi:hypothetical protein
VEARTEIEDPIARANAESLHYRTDSYQVLRGDEDGDAVELSSNFIRKADRAEVEPSERPVTPNDGEAVPPSDLLKDAVPRELTIANYLRPPQASQPGALPPTPDAPATDLDESDMAEAEVLDEHELEAEQPADGESDEWDAGDTLITRLEDEGEFDSFPESDALPRSDEELAPPGKPSPVVDTRSTLAKELLAAAPDSPVAQATQLRTNGECDAAMPLLEFEFFGDNSVAARLEYAQCTLEKGDYEEAEDRFSQLVESEVLIPSDHDLARYYLALTYEMSPQSILATQIFRRLHESAGDRFPDLTVRIKRQEREA